MTTKKKAVTKSPVEQLLQLTRAQNKHLERIADGVIRLSIESRRSHWYRKTVEDARSLADRLTLTPFTSDPLMGETIAFLKGLS